jgi:hypothetical protein
MNWPLRRSLAGLLMLALLPGAAAAQTAGDTRLLSPAGRRALLKGPSALQPQAPRVNDPVSDGIAIGALVGAATGGGLMAWAYAQCDGSCDAPEPAPMYLGAIGMGALVGGVTGWVIDRLHKGKGPSGAIVAPFVTKDRKSLTFSMRF